MQIQKHERYRIDKINTAYPLVKEINYSNYYWVDIDFGVKYIDGTKVQSPTIGVLLPAGYTGDNGITLANTVSGLVFASTYSPIIPGGFFPEVQFAFEVPHQYALGQSFFPHVHFINTTTVASTVAVQLEIDFVNFIGGTINTYSATVGHLITPDDALYSRHNVGFGGSYEGDPADITVSSEVISGQIQGNFRRANYSTITISGVGYPNYANRIGFLTLGFHIPVDSPGTRWELEK